MRRIKRAKRKIYRKHTQTSSFSFLLKFRHERFAGVPEKRRRRMTPKDDQLKKGTFSRASFSHIFLQFRCSSAHRTYHSKFIMANFFWIQRGKSRHVSNFSHKVPTTGTNYIQRFFFLPHASFSPYEHVDMYANKDNTQTHEFRPLTKNVGQEKSQPFIFCEYFILSFQCVALGILPYFLHNVEIDLDGYKIWEKILLCSWRHK